MRQHLLRQLVFREQYCFTCLYHCDFGSLTVNLKILGASASYPEVLHGLELYDLFQIEL